MLPSRLIISISRPQPDISGSLMVEDHIFGNYNEIDLSNVMRVIVISTT